MMLNTVSRQHSTSILILAVFSVVIILFTGYHSMNGLDGNGIFHQSDAYSCLFSICVALLMIFLMITVFLTFSPVYNPIFAVNTEPLFVLEKPPRR